MDEVLDLKISELGRRFSDAVFPADLVFELPKFRSVTRTVEAYSGPACAQIRVARVGGRPDSR